jgi:hypothetical protein
MGVGRNPHAPPGSKDAAGWVLADFPAAQADGLARMLTAGVDGIEAVLAKGIVAAMNQHNGKPSVA